ncbi:MAG: hypothetical protein H6739_12565 [Alphaproteobacteria bacterium]|nr:hypothetical protein [Alphaproteobacteria bacterium]
MAAVTDHLTRVEPDTFTPTEHFYAKVLNAQVHPLVRFFMTLGNERILQRYCHMHPEVDAEAVHELLASKPFAFHWAGADLFCTTTAEGRRQLVVIETNSCPSGQKSMPRVDEDQEQAGYRALLERCFLPLLRRRGLPPGGLAVLYDKNPMEAFGYARTLADLCEEPVDVVGWPKDSAAPLARFDAGVLEVRDAVDAPWRPVRAAFRYVTQRPWDRIPPITRTLIFNPVIACLAGGRNKMLAAKAYDLFNAEMEGTGLRVRVPETIWDVSMREVPLWVQRMGGVAVVKVPYTNAGQGVYTITNRAELDAFMALEQRYDRFIVQSLIGNASWSSRSRGDRLFHIGTVPDRKNDIYVADLRFMVGASPEGWFPVAVYARRTRKPLLPALDGTCSAWDMLGTNLSVQTADGGWDTETERLLLMDSRDFNKLGIGVDDLIEAYIRTILAATAIDRMARQLITQKGVFRRRLFSSLNPDPALLEEVIA